jgi:hypothetical protein
MEVVDLVTHTMQRITSSGFDPHSAPWDHKVCVMLHAAQGTIDNGGFEYFFEAPFDGQPVLEDFPKAFEAVGAQSSGAAVREAIKRAGSRPATFNDLDSVLWCESKRNYELLARYITEHASSYA